ncbi:M16 family metallopeptidase [Chromobacterium violaceum]|uniref:Zinc protease n=1 Tax=Chromobacterium violaceum (strain ATCC 12472 / DSM 30191 / JCM 1249 / CCUG 213 / NBRC 12614 / NCIMB 9131 / NCTC 9757 / MK) TaxID=243365 RepID=Q7NPY0_CHRVO|nr:pitrilysin family protein [Chromobacterium violaceum]AAQ62021.1 zinc protease [Chromobacterium violaceum ATCC 12472]SUX40767.1 protease3 [Chromobacterium violaceum]
MRLKTLSLLLALALSPALPIHAETAAPAVQRAQTLPYASVEGISEYRLANGLRVLLAPDDSKPTTTVNLTYLVGSRHEGYGETGMAHLLEHMLFKGTPTSGNLMSELSKRGMQFNGSTFFDRTNYYETFPADPASLDWALAMEADRMVNSKVARSDLDTEFSVVRNEMEQGENNPANVLWKQLSAITFDWHNYGHSTIGARSDVEKVRIENLQAFYRKYYQPDNAVLLVSGKFDPARALARIEAVFGKIPRPQRELVPTWTEEPQRDGEREVTVRRVGDTQLAATLYRTAASSHPDSAALQALAVILADTPNGRLYQSLVRAHKAVGVSAMPFELAEPGYILFMAELSKRQSLAEVRPILQASVEAIRAKPITAAELKRAKAALLKDIDQTLNDPQRLAVQLSESIAQGDWRLYFLQRDRIEALTVADVQRAAENYFKPSNRSYGQFIPTAQPDRAVIPPVPDVAAMIKGYQGKAAVAAGEAFDASPANIEARTRRGRLANGAEFALLAKQTRGNAVHGAFSFSFGDADSLRGQAATAELAANMLERGSRKLGRAAIADQLDALQASLDIGQDGQDLQVRFKTTRQNLPALLDLIAELLQQPAFPADEFEQLKRQALAGIDASRGEPQALAGQAVSQQLNAYARDDIRYSPTLDESYRDIAGVKLDALKRFHQQFYGAGHAQLALVGDFDDTAVRARLDQLFGRWNSKAAYRRVDGLLPPPKPASLSVATPDKANAVYSASLPLAISDDSPDYPALLLANEILGGGAQSRLLTRLRQQDGISYGAGSGVDAASFGKVGAWRMGAIFAPQNLDKLKRGVAEELARLLRDGVTAQELAEAKQGLLRTYQVALAQDGPLSDLLQRQLWQGRTMAFTQERLATLDRLTVDDVNAALRKYLKPELLTQAYAGDFAAKPAAGQPTP